LKKATSTRHSSARRRRDPDATRVAILEAARTLLAKHGPNGLSVSQVAQLAGVNRGTAYQHFQTREQLLEETAAWVSEKLCNAVYGEGSAGNDGIGPGDPQGVVEHLVGFAMENPELSRIWLFEVLNSNRPANDLFWKQYKTRFEKFANSELAQPGIDCEVSSVLVLIGAFLWPVWARAHAHSAKERQEMAKRFSCEVLRLSLHGTMRAEKYSELDARLSKDRDSRRRGR
jgi:AcrR family transcriptional regulator